eukprot:2709367-Pleurochrysis_carterae.AAC.1
MRMRRPTATPTVLGTRTSMPHAPSESHESFAETVVSGIAGIDHPLRCACVRERALRDNSRPLPALACAADDLERVHFYAKNDLDTEEV